MCHKTAFDFICDACQKGYLTQVGVCEHYYHKHLNKHLYFCKKCNKGFHFKSKRSNHKKACPKEDEEDKFLGELELDPELEVMFRRRQPIEMDVPDEVLEFAMREEEECRKVTEVIRADVGESKEGEPEPGPEVEPVAECGTGKQTVTAEIPEPVKQFQPLQADQGEDNDDGEGDEEYQPEPQEEEEEDDDDDEN